MEGESGLREAAASFGEEVERALGGEQRRSLLEVYQKIGEANFLVSRLRDPELAGEMERVISRFRRIQSSPGAAVDKALAEEAERILGKFDEWLDLFEQLLSEPVRFPDNEIEFDRRLLYYREFGEEAASGLRISGAGAQAQEILRRMGDRDLRLETIIKRYCPFLFREFPNYSVLRPGDFPDGFWWRHLVWDMRSRL